MQGRHRVVRTATVNLPSGPLTVLQLSSGIVVRADGVTLSAQEWAGARGWLAMVGIREVPAAELVDPTPAPIGLHEQAPACITSATLVTVAP